MEEVKEEIINNNEVQPFREYLTNKQLWQAFFVYAISSFIVTITTSTVLDSTGFDWESSIAIFIPMTILEFGLPLLLVSYLFRNKLKNYIAEINKESSYIREYFKFGAYIMLLYICATLAVVIFISIAMG